VDLYSSVTMADEVLDVVEYGVCCCASGLHFVYRFL
jgi:hypothetical protein